MKPAFSTFLFIILSLILSCKEDNPKDVTCGCNGPTDTYIVNGWSRYLGAVRFGIKLLPTSQTEIMVTACSIDKNWIVSTDTLKPNYLVTANTKLSCQPLYSSYRGPTEIKITKITKLP